MTISAQAGARPINTARGGVKLLVANTVTDAERPAAGEPVSLQAPDLPGANAITRAAGGMPAAARRVEESSQDVPISMTVYRQERLETYMGMAAVTEDIAAAMDIQPANIPRVTGEETGRHMSTPTLTPGITTPPRANNTGRSIRGLDGRRAVV